MYRRRPRHGPSVAARLSMSTRRRTA
jgi:hypothetical protein